MSFVAAAIGGGALIGAIGTSIAADKSSDAAVAAGKFATDESGRQYDQTREDMIPWLEAGRGALVRQNALLDGDYSGFLNSPDYLAALNQGTRQLDMGAASAGNLWGGGADADRIQFGQQLATQNLGNYWNRLAGMSGTGQQTAGSLGQFGANHANQVGQNQWGVANARASAYGQQAGALNDAIDGGLGAYGYYKGWGK